MKPIKIDVEQMWLFYVNMSLKDINPRSVQFTESRRVFYAAVGQTLLTLRDDVSRDDISEDEGAAIMQDMLNQINDFWQRQK